MKSPSDKALTKLTGDRILTVPNTETGQYQFGPTLLDGI